MSRRDIILLVVHRGGTMQALAIAALYLGTALAAFVLAVDVLDVVDPLNRLIAH